MFWLRLKAYWLSDKFITVTSQWARCVSNHQPCNFLLKRLFRRRSKKTSKLRVTGLCAGNSTGARLDARTYTFAHPIWRTINAARKHGAISPILPVFCRYYRCDAIMLIKLSTVWPWVTGITTLEVAIVIVNFARDARMNTVNVCRMRERIKQDARTSLLMRERTHIVRCGSFN